VSDRSVSNQRFPSPRQGWERRINHRPFGRRPLVPSNTGVSFLASRFGGVDGTLPDLRRRIGEVRKYLPGRLPLAVCGVVILSTSAVMWTSVAAIARDFASAIARMF
jgi:hypothetical protein